MTKREFMIQYVLNRALTSDNLCGKGCAEQADNAWQYIQAKTTRLSGEEILK